MATSLASVDVLILKSALSEGRLSVAMDACQLFRNRFIFTHPRFVHCILGVIDITRELYNLLSNIEASHDNLECFLERSDSGNERCQASAKFTPCARDRRERLTEIT